MSSIYKKGRPKRCNPAKGTGQKPPAKPGEYRIINIVINEVVYIGMTCLLNRRMQEHIRTGKLGADCVFDYQVADGRSTSRTRAVHERMKICKHKPSLNKTHGGEGRFAKK